MMVIMLILQRCKGRSLSDSIVFCCYKKPFFSIPSDRGDFFIVFSVLSDVCNVDGDADHNDDDVKDFDDVDVHAACDFFLHLLSFIHQKTKNSKNEIATKTLW